MTALTVPLLPFIRDEFTLDYTRAGFVIAAFNLVYGLSQVPAGWLADRIAPRILVTIGICGVAVTGFLVGISHTYIMLLVFLVLMGLLGGGYHPASTAMISASVKPKSLGQALGFHMMGGSASYFLAPLIAAGIAATLGWRGSFIALTIPTMALGILLHVLLRRRMPTGKARPQTISDYAKTQATPGRRRRWISLVVLSSFNQAMLMSIVSFVPLFLVDYFGTGKELAAASISLVYFMGLWAGPLGGYLSDRLGRVPIMLAMCFLGGTVIYLLTVAPYPIGLVAILVIFGIIIYFNTTVSQAYIVDQISERHRSTALGFYFFGNMEGSGVLTPVLGYLIDKLGFHPSFIIAGIALIALTLACSLFLWVSRERSSRNYP